MRLDGLALPAPAANHRLAFRMGLISFITQNAAIGCMFGSFAVLITSVEARMGIGRTMSTLAVPLVILCGAIVAPIAGNLSGRISLRLMLMIGATWGALGFVFLAFTNSIYVYLFAYALLIGPYVSVCGSVLPAILVTRWFAVGRGRALGLMFMPLGVSVLPLVTSVVLHRFGLQAVYLMLGAITALTLLPMVFIVDTAPGTAGEGEAGTPGAAPGNGLVWSTGQILRSPRFWVFTLGWSATISGSVILGSHLVAMAALWGIGPTVAVGLLASMAVAAMAGGPVFGWLGDRLGGGKTMAILCFSLIAVWAALLFHPAFAVVAVAVPLSGLLNGAGVSVVNLSLAEQFGRASFGRAFGLASTAILPFTILNVPIAGSIFMRTGSYSGAILAQMGFYLVAAILVLLLAGRRNVVLDSALASNA